MVYIFFAIIFFLVVYYVNSDSDSNGEADPGSFDSKFSSLGSRTHVVKLLSSMMMADGKPKKVERKRVDKYLRDNFDVHTADLMRDALDYALKYPQEEDLRSHCFNVSQFMTYKQRLVLLTTLFEIAVADSRIQKQEAKLIELYARFACIKQVDFDRQRGYFAYGFAWENTGKQQSWRQSQSSENDSFDESAESRNGGGHDSDDIDNCSNVYDWAYEALGLPKNASKQDIKNAYRKLSLQYHPDRQLDATDEELKLATEQFMRINEAYEVLSE